MNPRLMVLLWLRDIANANGCFVIQTFGDLDALVEELARTPRQFGNPETIGMDVVSFGIAQRYRVPREIRRSKYVTGE